MNSLRPRQSTAIQDVRKAYAAGKRAPILVAPTGFGKTHTAAAIIKSALDKGKTVWFLAHLKEILEDTAGRLRSVNIPFGEIAAGKPKEYHRRVQIVSVQTAVRRDDLPKPDLVIVDECHLAVAKTYLKVLGKIDRPMLLGLTGTPCRLDGRGLGELFDEIIPTCSTELLIDEGLLAPIKYFAPHRPDLTGLRVQAGDYKQSDLAAEMDRSKITGDAIKHYRKHCDGKRTVVFCTSIEHAEHVAEEFNAAGYRAVAISGKSKSSERNAALTGLRSGEIQVVCNAQLWAAGVDVPQIECIVLLRPTKSLTFYLQAIGRGLRVSPGKTHLTVLDHSGSIFEHGPPWMQRIWSLVGRPKKEGVTPVRQCPACLCAHVPAPVCPECGYEYPEPKKNGPEKVDGELSEIDMRQAAALERLAKRKEQIAKKAEQGRAKTLEQLIELGRSRGYKHPVGWARKIMASRHF
jgi:superfamily II DNA or RNA helicase